MTFCRTMRARSTFQRLKAIRLAVWFTLGLPIFSILGQEDPGVMPAADPIPPLRPASPPIGPDFWETHRGEVFLGAAAFLALLMLCIWWLRRARHSEPVPPGRAAQRSLSALRGQTEEGVIVSRVSQVLKCYLVGALRLPPAEMTTKEVVAVIETAPALDSATARDFADFFRQADLKKFAPAGPVSKPAGGGVVERALELVDRAEKCFGHAEAEKNQKQTS
jgi:hypothetical protein